MHLFSGMRDSTTSLSFFILSAIMGALSYCHTPLKEIKQTKMIEKKIVKALVEEWLQDKEYFLVDIEISLDDRIVVEIDHADGVWIEDCCDLSRFIEEHLSRDEEDYELEVGSAGLGQPFKVEQQYINCIDKEVEVLTATGIKIKGILKSVEGRTFTVAYKEKQQVEGKKRPQLVEVEKPFSMDEVKYCKYVINFK